MSELGFIKMCEVCREEDARLCIASGTNTIGILITRRDHEEPTITDRVSIDAAEALAGLVHKSGGQSVALYHHDLGYSLCELHDSIRPTFFQLQFDVGLEEIASLRAIAPSIKTVSLTHDWNRAREITRATSLPTILAGGLTPENVA